MLKTDDHIFKGMQKCMVDDAFTFVFLSDAFLELLGYTRSELQEQFNNSFFAMLDQDVIMFILDELALQSEDENSMCNMSFQMKTRAGKTVYLQLSGYLLEEADGLTYYFSVLDITRFYEMDSYYRNLLENLPIPVFVADTNTNVKFINERGRAHFCSKRQDVAGLMCKEFDTDCCGTDQCCMELAKLNPGGTHFMHLGDAVYQVYENAMPVQEGEIPTYCMAALDVSDIFTMSETNRALVDNTFIGVIKMRCDASRQLLYANEEYYDLLGYSKAEWFSRRKAIIQGYCEDGFGDLLTEIDLALASGQEKVEYEFLTTQQSGKQVWLLMRGQFDRGQEVPVLNGVFMDITDRKVTEEELRQAKERYRIALGQRAIAVWEYDPVQRRLCHDDKVSRVYGLPNVIENMPEELLNLGIIHPDFSAQYLDLHNAIRSGQKSSSCVVKTRFRDGVYHWTKISYIAEQDEHGACIRAIGFSEDVTDIKNLQISSILENKDKEALAKNAVYSFEADVTDNRIISTQMEFLSKTTGITPPDKFSSMMDTLLERYVLQEDKAVVMDTFSQQSLMEAATAGEAEVFCDYRVLDSSGNIVWMRAVGVLSLQSDNHHLIMFNYTVNIDRQKRRQLNVLERSQRDLLSSMHNRESMSVAVDSSMQAAEDNRTDALFLIAMDNLERIAANFGSHYNDHVLHELAYKLTSLFPAKATMGRLDKHIFAVFSPHITREEALVQMAALNNRLHQSYTQNEITIALSPYTGVSMSPDNGTSFTELLTAAEKALFFAHTNSEENCAMFDAGLMDNIEDIHLARELQVDVVYNNAYCQNVQDMIFRLLYLAEDFDVSVQSALQFVCRHFDVQCGYIMLFDYADRMYCAYQWSDEGYKQEIPMYPFTKNAQYAYLNMFSGSGFCLLPNYAQAPKIFHENKAAHGAASVMEGSFMLNGHVSGLFGLNEYRHPRIFSDAQKSLFKLICDIMGTFISANQIQKRMELAQKMCDVTLDSEPNPAMVIDKENHQVLYSNAAAKKAFHGLNCGGSCYECLYEQDEPCKDCPLEKAEKEKLSWVEQEIYIPRENRWIKVTATPIPWKDGKTHYLTRNRNMLISG